MRNNIYISSLSFNKKDLPSILAECRKYGLVNIELGSDVDYIKDAYKMTVDFSKNGMNFLIHNYFPRPPEDFVINLASDDGAIISRSMAHCKKAIDLSSEVGAPFYSVHAGFAFRALPRDLGRNSVARPPLIPYKKAYGILVDNVQELAGYAVKKNIILAVENNVITKSRLTAENGRMLLLTDTGEMARFYDDVGSSSLKYLIDVGHLKVAAATLGFDAAECIAALRPLIAGFHLSDNDGALDQHLPFDEGVWFGQIIADCRDKIFVIETEGLETGRIVDIAAILEKMVS